MRATIGCLLIVGVLAMGCWRAAPPAAGPATSAKKVWDREDLKKAVIGKTTEEVKAVLGVPDKTSEADNAKYWTYFEVSRDPVTGKTDKSTTLFFSNGRTVSSVAF